MAKKQHEENYNPYEIERTPMSEQKVYYGLHYRKVRDQWVGERLGCHSDKVMRSLVDKWKKEIDSDGFYMGEIKGNKYPEIPNYDTLKKVNV